MAWSLLLSLIRRTKRKEGKAMNLMDIEVRNEDGVFKVPADFKEGFKLVPRPSGRLSLVFWDRGRMRRFLRSHGFCPSVRNCSKN